MKLNYFDCEIAPQSDQSKIIFVLASQNTCVLSLPTQWAVLYLIVLLRSSRREMTKINELVKINEEIKVLVNKVFVNRTV